MLMKRKATATAQAVQTAPHNPPFAAAFAGYIPLSEISDDPNADPQQMFKVGDEVEVFVIRVNDVEGTIMLSKKKIDSFKGWESILKAEESGDVLEGVVTDVIKGGVIVLSNGVKVFIPASQATQSRNTDLNSLLRTNVKFKIIEVNKPRHRAVGSIKIVAKTERKAAAEKIWNEIEAGKQYTGVVQSIMPYGVFVDLGGLDGMVHISELSWKRIKNPSEVVKVGDLLTVYIKDFDKEKGRISLGYKKSEDDPWELIKKYNIGDVVEVTIVRLMPFGAFAEIIPGIDGLIHISQISNQRVAKVHDVLTVGQKVQAKITEIDFEKKKINLSMKALIEETSETAVPEQTPSAE
jgi:4-hydroxy-3-methylbut-2-enyl diphosphate reductase